MFFLFVFRKSCQKVNWKRIQHYNNHHFAFRRRKEETTTVTESELSSISTVIHDQFENTSSAEASASIVHGIPRTNSSIVNFNFFPNILPVNSFGIMIDSTPIIIIIPFMCWKRKRFMEKGNRNSYI